MCVCVCGIYYLFVLQLGYLCLRGPNSYIVAVVCVFAQTLRHLWRPEHGQKDHPLMRSFAFRAMAFYAGGFLLFWLPEQFLCGNQNLPHHERGPIQALTDLPVRP